MKQSRQEASTLLAQTGFITVGKAVPATSAHIQQRQKIPANCQTLLLNILYCNLQ